MQAIVFDFDGPIFDGRRAARRATDDLLQLHQTTAERALGVSLPLLDSARVVGLLYPDLELAERAQVREAYRRLLDERERELGVSRTTLDTLGRLEEAGVSMALLSARRQDNLDALVDDFGLRRYFSEVLSVRKPDPQGLTAVAEKLGLMQSHSANEQRPAALAELALVGDSDADYAMANTAKVTYYHAGWTAEPCALAATEADRVLGSLDELAAMVELDRQVRLPARHTKSAIRDALRHAIASTDLSFYAGAGISRPSGIGDWVTHYEPLLRELGASFIRAPELPEALQLLAEVKPKAVFDRFKESFAGGERPNPYHHAILRALPRRIWTSNYDRLFEQANSTGNHGYRVVYDDVDLQRHFRDQIIVKMNGDFERAAYAETLDWGLVFLQEQFDRAESSRPEIWRLFEDDYRSSQIVFVGTSFRDPALRRIVSVARRKLLRTRYDHLLLALRARSGAERLQQALFAQNLKRVSITTVLHDSPEEIRDTVEAIALQVNRPVVGVSGSVGAVDLGQAQLKPAEDTAPGLTMPYGKIEAVCRELGTQLARRGLRVSSGCASYVGIPAVEAAFTEEPKSARFYLRRRGGRSYPRTAPAVVVPGDDYQAMRRVFVEELGCLVAIAGRKRDGPSGTREELELAIGRGVPIVLLPQAGGVTADFARELPNRLEGAYRDDRLRGAVRAINHDVASVPADALQAFVREELVRRIENLLQVSMGRSPESGRGQPIARPHHW